MGNSTGRTLIAGGSILFCGLCGWQSVRLGLGVTPDNAQYHFRRWQASTAPAGIASPDLDRAVALNPRFTAAWIAHGLEAEVAGDRKKAEASLLQAAATDRTYRPSWALANFYLRAGDGENFWKWVRPAAAMASDPAAVFQLCWRMSSESREILERGIPPFPAARRAYLDFLLRTNRYEAAGALASEIAQAPDSGDLDPLLRYCDAALAAHQVVPALNVWNALARRGFIPYREGALLTNGDLVESPLGRGFDWRLGRVTGVSLNFDTASRALVVSLSGKQPESCDLIEQFLALESGAVYRFGFMRRTRDLPAGNGLSWSFVDAKTGVQFAAAEDSLEFAVPASAGLARLVLRYRRPSGSVRAEGSIEFSRFTLERAG